MASTVLQGKVSWFGGPHDPEDSGHTASGGTTAEPGIAVYNHKTLGGYWRVTASNGRTAVLKQTDIGPAPWTKRLVDVTYSALGHLGYNEHNFPTDSQVKAEYLGQSPKVLQSAPNAIGGSTTTSHTTLDRAGLEAAQQRSRGLLAAASLFSGNKPGDVALRESLQRAGAPPEESAYQHTYTSTALAKTPTGTYYTPASTGYVHPLPGAQIGRTDQGVDMSAPPGRPIRAIGDSKVLGIHEDWYKGQPYVELELQNGPKKGQIYYVAEQIAPSVHAGQFVRGGHAIGHVASQGTGLELGWGARGGRTQAQATTGYREGQETRAGQDFASFLKGLR